MRTVKIQTRPVSLFVCWAIRSKPMGNFSKRTRYVASLMDRLWKIGSTETPKSLSSLDLKDYWLKICLVLRRAIQDHLRIPNKQNKWNEEKLQQKHKHVCASVVCSLHFIRFVFVRVHFVLFKLYSVFCLFCVPRWSCISHLSIRQVLSQ